MAIQANLQTPNLRTKPGKAQDQDNPTAAYGRYGLYRAIAQASTPRLQVEDPVGRMDQPTRRTNFSRGGR